MKSFGSSRHAKRPGKNGSATSKTVRKTSAEAEPTARRRRALAQLAKQPDGAIDTSEIPELTDAFWEKAVRNPFYRPVKKQLTVRLDADVLAWLRRQGRGYQTRINVLLREAMMKELGKSSA